MTAPPRRQSGVIAPPWRMLALLLLTALPAVAFADARETNQRALKLAYEADDLYARGQWGAAYERFAEADALAHSPVFVLYMARCRKNAGRLLEAEALLARLARESVATSAPKPFHDAVASAAAERDEVARRIPLVHVVVQGAAAGPVRVKVDGKEIADARAGITLDPGAHGFDASSGGASDHKDVLLADGAGEVRVVLTLSSGGPTPQARPTRQAEREASTGSLAPTLVALAVGVAGVGIGSVTGAMAASKAGRVKTNCVDSHCLQSDADALDSARRLATISTVAFIAGGAGLAAAGVLFVIRPRGGQTTATAAVTPAWIGLYATF
jgi:hypothetical protein